MKKQFALIFLLGALTGGVLTVICYSGNHVADLGAEKLPESLPNQNTSVAPVQNTVMEVPKYPEQQNDNAYPDAEEYPDSVSSETEQSERSLAGEPEPEANGDDMPSTAPEEAPAENPEPEPSDSEDDEEKDV